MSETTKRGIIFSLVAALISGVSIFYNKLIIIKGVEPIVLNIFKNGGVALIFSLIVLTAKRNLLYKLSKTDWFKLITLGIIGGGIPFVLFFEGLKYTSSINANLIQKTMFLYVAVLALSLLKEKLNLLQVIGYCLIFASNFFIGGFSGFQFNRGEFIILLATLFWSLEFILIKKLNKKIETAILSWGRMFFGLFIILLTLIIQNKFGLQINIRGDQILPIVGSILFLLGYVTCFYKALKYAPAGMVVSILIIATPITNILTAIFITHTFPQTQVINMFFSVIGVGLITLLPKAKLSWIKTG